MEEPLLGNNPQRGSSLFRILENSPFFRAPSDEEYKPLGVPVPLSPSPVPLSRSQFKERLVYGSFPAESPRNYYLPRLFSNQEQYETEEFLAESERRRSYNFHPGDGSPKHVSAPQTAEDPAESDAKAAENEVNEVPVAESPADFSSFSSSSEECLDQYVAAAAAAQEEGRARNKEGEEGEARCLLTVTHRRKLTKSRTAPALNVRFSANNLAEKKVKRPQLETAATVVMQASFGLLAYLAIGMAIYVWRRDDFSGKSTVPLVDGLYFCIVTMCTIGYGDITPLSPETKLFACLFVLVGFGFIDILLSGMVAYVLERQEHLLLSAVEGRHHETARNYLVNTEKGRMRIRTKVGLAITVVIFCLALGTLVMHWTEDLNWVDSFYLSCMSVTTVGYGDHTFKTMAGRLFAAVWLLVSTLAVARSFLFLAEARIDRRNRLIAKWVLHRGMTVGDLVAADIDNNGFVTKSEYVIYKLKEMQRIGEQDILDVCRQFSYLDKDNSGRITISQLMDSPP